MIYCTPLNFKQTLSKKKAMLRPHKDNPALNAYYAEDGEEIVCCIPSTGSYTHTPTGVKYVTPEEYKKLTNGLHD